MTTPPPEPRPRRFRGWVALLAIALFTGGFILSLWLLTRGNMRPPPEETRTYRGR